MSEWSLRPDQNLTILIPARAGSRRVPGKNTRVLSGKPLIQWSIDAAKAANVAQIIVSTDDAVAEGIARDNELGIHHRKPAHATDDAPDFLWVEDLQHLIQTPYFAICRPTSPFRTASTIRRGFAALVGSRAHSIRAVARVTAPHPAKMWQFTGRQMTPVLVGSFNGTPWHSLPTQVLPPIYLQTASLEIAQTWVIAGTRTITGTTIAPFLTDALESFDINTPADFVEAERLAATY